MPDLAALRTLVSVQEAGSVRLAARQMGVSDSAVSQSLRSLEASLGLTLFDRAQRPLQLTPQGQTLLEPARALLAQARQLSAQAAKLRAGGLHTIRLGCVDSFAATIGPELIRGLSGRVRELRMLSGITPDIVEQLRRRAVDFAICTDAQAGDARVRALALFSEPWVAVFPKNRTSDRRIERFRRIDTLARDLPLIRYTARSVIGQQIESFLQHARIQAPPRFAFDATDPMLSLVASGLGWAVTSPLCLLQSRHFLDQVQVLALPRTELGQRRFYLLCMEGEWNDLDWQIADLVRAVVQRTVVPALRAALPGLALDRVRIHAGGEL